MNGDDHAKDFVQEIVYLFKGHKYSVRDNGQVFRHEPEGLFGRENDGFWTVGKPSKKDGYLEIASVPVHQIIATAFHGERPSNDHVVDHIDGDKYNNRPANLRWIRRLVNLLLDPITAKRIAKRCGSVEAFLSAPEKFRESFNGEKYEWIGGISVQAARDVLDDLFVLAEIEDRPSGGSLDRWLVGRIDWLYEDIVTEKRDELIIAITPNAAQRHWSVPSEFPCCPWQYDEPISSYAAQLKAGAVFCQNHIYNSVVSECAISTDAQSLYIITQNKQSGKQWGLAKITYEQNMFVHTSLGTFFKQDGAQKEFCLAQGLEWSGGDTFDDLVG